MAINIFSELVYFTKKIAYDGLKAGWLVSLTEQMQDCSSYLYKIVNNVPLLLMLVYFTAHGPSVMTLRIDTHAVEIYLFYTANWAYISFLCVS